MEKKIKNALRPLVHRIRRVRGHLTMRHGRISSLVPLSQASGFDRGTPIDRFYIEAFLERHASDIRGRVLEADRDLYSTRFGGKKVEKVDVLHADSTNPLATMVGDLADPGTLPEAAFDCILLTQTLQYVFDLPAALANIRRALRPGGVALITVPAISAVSKDPWSDSHFWRFNVPGVRRLLEAQFGKKVEVEGRGNLYAATTFLHAAAVEEVVRSKLDPVDPYYAVVVLARAVA